LPIYAGQRITPATLEAAGDLAGLTTGSVTNTVTETTIGTFSSGYQGGDGSVNTVYDFFLTGTFDTTSTPTLRLRLYVASAASGNRIWDSSATATGGTNTGQPFWIIAKLVITATGSTGTFDSGGISQGANWNSANLIASNFSGNAIDTTSTHDIILTALWGTASSSNTCRTTGGQMSKM
jgi:hypothetical protein